MKPDSIGQHNRQGSGNNVGLKVPDDVRFARLNRTYSTEITCFFGAAAAKTAATSRFIAHQAPILYNIIPVTSTLLQIFSSFAYKNFSRTFGHSIVYFAQYSIAFSFSMENSFPLYYKIGQSPCVSGQFVV
jgi:hypothetical protein